MDLKALYAEECDRHKCKVNSAIKKQLDGKRPNDVTKLDISLNFVGPVGAQALSATTRHLPFLSTINFDDNQLDNNAINIICNNLEGHVGLSSLVFRQNPISHQGGKRLQQFVAKNTNITSIDLTHTLINPALIKAIEDRANSNAKVMSANPVAADEPEQQTASNAAGEPAAAGATSAETQPSEGNGSCSEGKDENGTSNGSKDGKEGKEGKPSVDVAVKEEAGENKEANKSGKGEDAMPSRQTTTSSVWREPGSALGMVMEVDDVSQLSALKTLWKVASRDATLRNLPPRGDSKTM